MKKLFFYTGMLLIFSQTHITPTESPSIMKTIMARFEAFKQYLLHNTQTITPSPTAALIKRTTPIAFYYPKKNPLETTRIILTTINNAEPININAPSNTLYDVNAYTFSPQRKYLLVQQTKTEGIATRFGGDWLGKQANATFITRLIDANTRQDIVSFANKTIMHEFSPDETTVLIASPQKSWREKFGQGPNAKGASPAGAHSPRAGKREQSATGEILRYDLLDIASQKILKTFENIQTITYIAANKLFIKYDNDMMEIITIEKNKPSFIQAIMSFFSQQQTINVISTPTEYNPFNIRTEYDEKQKTLTLQIHNNPEQIYHSVVSYHMSPRDQYILIQQLSESTLATIEGMQKNVTGDTAASRTITKLINLITGKEITTFENLITHEFSQDESRLLVLCTQPVNLIIQVTSSDYLYRLYDTTKENSELIQFDATTQSAYFSSLKELTVIDKNGYPILYDPVTGQTYQSIHQHKQQLINKEILEREQAKQAKQTQIEDEKKQKHFDTLTPKEQVALPRTELPKAEIAKRDTFTSPMTAVKERGIASVKQAATEFATDVKEYFLPTTPEQQPAASIATKTEEQEEFSEPEDMDDWMNAFAQNSSNQSSVISVIEQLYLDSKDDRNDFIEHYNKYTPEIKKQFAAFFFAPPAGNLQESLTSTSAKGTHLTADVVNDHLYISDTRKTTNAVIFTSNDLDNDIKVMAFSNNELYFVLSYDDERKIDILQRTNDEFVEFKQLVPDNPIIGFKFIETQHNIYLFCVDTTYAITIITLDQKQPASPATI